MDKKALADIASRMVAPGKGILAADESSGTIKKRFDTIDVESTETNRRDWREMLFCTQPAMNECISGVILFDETIRQTSDDGTRLVDLITRAGAIPGIKVDKGAKPIAGFPGETVTEGLDGLRERLAEYYELGARFAKWRAVITIKGDTLPTDYCIEANMHALARYAALCQEAGIVPIVEPEVLMDGEHCSARCAEVTEASLKSLYAHMDRAGVYLPGTILKPNMVLCGTDADNRAGVQQVAEQTVRILKACVPADVPGIAFLSGGQSDEEATAHLDAMNKIGDLPWALTFSYGRALQASPLKAWSGKDTAAGAEAFNHRARMNSLATKGAWVGDLEDA